MKLSDIQIQSLCSLAKKAGDAILSIYDTDIAVEKKEDDSPLTRADIASHQIIISGLANQFPGIPILSEESAQIPYVERKDWQTYWLVDPLDGTKEFIKKNGEFTVNIALIQNRIPVAGIVYAPVLNRLYFGRNGAGAFMAENENPPRLLPLSEARSDDALVVVGSRSHSNPQVSAFVENLKKKQHKIRFIAMGSSLKICLVAQGLADIYPRLGPTMEWDTAAAHAVVLAAGKQLNQYPENTPLVYNKENLLNPWFIVK